MDIDNSENSQELYTFKPFRFDLVKPNPSSEVPAPRSGHKIVCSSTVLYLYGGYNPDVKSISSTGALKELWKFNISTKIWKKYNEKQKFSDGVVSAAAIRRQQKLLVYGGTGVPFGLASSNFLSSFNLNEDEGFKKIKINGEGPVPQYGQAIVMHKNSLYVVGGTTGFEYKCDIYRADLNRNPKMWIELYKEDYPHRELPNAPEGRYGHEIAFDGTFIYILGGGTAFKSHDLVNIHTFNIKERTWDVRESKPDIHANSRYPQPRKCYGAVQFKTDKDIHVYIMGGYENNLTVFNDLWRLDLKTLQWTLIQRPTLPRGIYLHSMGSTRQGKLYVFGGIKQGAELERSNEMYSAWTCIPKLADIAWEALLHYYPQICSSEVRSSLNLPNCFINNIMQE